MKNNGAKNSYLLSFIKYAGNSSISEVIFGFTEFRADRQIEVDLITLFVLLTQIDNPLESHGS